MSICLENGCLSGAARDHDVSEGDLSGPAQGTQCQTRVGPPHQHHQEVEQYSEQPGALPEFRVQHG